MRHNGTVRVGMVTPSSNTCLEPMTYRLLGDTREVSAHFSRVAVTRIGLDAGSDSQFGGEAMSAAAMQLIDAKVDVVVWNGTSGSWLGADGERELAARLTRQGGVAATTSTLAMLEACRVYGVTRLGVATPYTAEVNNLIVKQYATQGVDVIAESHLGMSDNESFANIPETQVARQLREVATDAHAVAVVCTNVPGAPLAHSLEAELGIPVFDSVAVTLWHALQLVRPSSIAGFGTLLRDGAVRSEMQGLCDTLLRQTGADRTTLRVDLPEHGLEVTLTAAESLRPGVRPIRREGSLDQRRLNTVEWLETHRRNLVQPHFRCAPQPPQALTDVYGVAAQMLGPIEHGGAMTGWLSAHSLTERAWTAADQAAMDAVRHQAEDLIADRLRNHTNARRDHSR